MFITRGSCWSDMIFCFGEGVADSLHLSWCEMSREIFGMLKNNEFTHRCYDQSKITMDSFLMLVRYTIRSLKTCHKLMCLRYREQILSGVNAIEWLTIINIL